jgi:hypothetical protein
MVALSSCAADATIHDFLCRIAAIKIPEFSFGAKRAVFAGRS